MREKIEKAIRETLVIENKQSIHYAVDRIMKLIETEGIKSPQALENYSKPTPPESRIIKEGDYVEPPK